MNGVIFYDERGRSLLWIWDEDKGGYGYCRFYG